MIPESRLEAVAGHLESLVEDLRSQLDRLGTSSLHGGVAQPEFMTIAGVAEVFSVGERTLRRLRAQRGFPRPVKGPGKLRWRRSEIVRWMEKSR